MHINFRSHNFYTGTFELYGAIIMNCQRLFRLFTGKQRCLQTNKYNQSRGVLEIYASTNFCDLICFRFEDMSVESEEEEEEMNTTAHHSALHYDAKDQGNPYIISTMVLSDMHVNF